MPTTAAGEGRIFLGAFSAASIRPNDEDEALAREGLEALAGEGKLGALLIQFPVSFKNTSLNREYLEKLLRQFIEYPRPGGTPHFQSGTQSAKCQNSLSIRALWKPSIAYAAIEMAGIPWLRCVS